MTTWRVAAILLVVTAALLTVGVAVESGNEHNEATERASTLPGVEGSAEHETAERSEASERGEAVERRDHEEGTERLLGIVHQIREDRIGLVILAAAVAVGHVAAGTLAGGPLRRYAR
jgi:hypothetical protein